MRTDIAIEKLCNIVPFVADIAENLKSNQEMKDFILQYNADKTNKVFMIRILPLLFKHYNSQIFEVLALLNDKTVEDVKAQPFGETYNQIKDIIGDEDFKGFFSLFIENKKPKEGLAE